MSSPAAIGSKKQRQGVADALDGMGPWLLAARAGRSDRLLAMLSLCSTEKERRELAARRHRSTGHVGFTEGWTALHYAANGGSKECVEILMPLTDRASGDDAGFTPLMAAAVARSESCVELLMPKSDVDAKCAREGTPSWTALHFAAHAGDREVVELLMRECDPTIADRKGSAAASVARSCGYHEIADLIGEQQARRERALLEESTEGCVATSPRRSAKSL